MAQSISELFALYADESRARETMERLRWPNGPRCIKCGSVDVYRITSAANSTTQKGLLRCRDCDGQFSVTVGTVFEDSKIPLGKWLIAIHLLCASKKGMSAHQLHRMLGVTYKTAWFMAHRIRYAMSVDPMKDMLHGVVEIDETFIGGKPENRHKGDRFTRPKMAVLSLVERNGRARSLAIPNVTGPVLRKAIRERVSTKARVMTDGYGAYRGMV